MDVPRRPNRSLDQTLADTQAYFGRSKARPLSDIRELTEPNLCERATASARIHTQAPPASKIERPATGPSTSQHARHTSLGRSFDGNDDKASIYSIPLEIVPPRSSSRPPSRRTGARSSKRECSLARQPAISLPPPQSRYRCIANNGQAQSPVRDIVLRLYAQGPTPPRMPSKTIVKIESSTSQQVLEQPLLQHPRLKVALLMAAPLFVGGSSVEGVVRIVVDQAERVRHRKTLVLERVSVNLFGLEEISVPTLKRKTFLALGNELVDNAHPPPDDMIESQQPLLSQRSWILVPSVSTLPFLIKLPLNVGPPPFRSRVARIRYIISATLIIKDAGRQLSVRQTEETILLSVQDRTTFQITDNSRASADIVT